MIAPDLETAVARLRDAGGRGRGWWCPSPAPASPPSAASPISARPGGIWTKMRPIEFGDFLASQEMRDESWRRRVRHGGAVRRRQAGPRPPGAGESLPGRQDSGVITQNIDNLHQASGISAEDVVELHGNTTYATCLDCAKRYELSWVKERLPNQAVVRRNARSATATSRPRPCRSASRCRSARMQRAQELTEAAICFSPSVRRWWSGRRRAFRCWQSATARGLHHQSRRDRVRRHRRSRRARRHRHGARAVHCALIQLSFTQARRRLHVAFISFP